MLARAATVEAPTPYGWDWSSTTHDVLGSGLTAVEFAKSFAQVLGGAHVLPCAGWQRWSEGLEVFDCDGYRLGRVFHGGQRSDVHVVSTSSAADLVRSEVLERAPGKTARVDTRVDSLVGYDDLAKIMEEAAEMYGSEVVHVTGRKGHRGERYDSGRTMYLGAPSSAVRVRLYEKWLESPGQYVEGTNRVEVQLRPASKVKDRVSGWTRAETFCASRVTRDLAERLGADVAPVASLHVARGTPDLERSLEAMGEQYGRAAARWLELSQGDVTTLLDYLTAKVPDAPSA